MRASALLDPGGFGCVPRDSGYLWTLGRLRLEAPRGRAPSGRHHNEPQVFVKRAEAPPGKTQELEYLFSSETFRFRPGSLGAVGARTEVPRRGAAPSRGARAPLTAAGAQPALLRRGLGPRRGARRGWPGQAASLAPGSVKARPASPPAGSRTTEDPARLGRKGGAARSTSHSKATRKRDLGCSGPTGCKTVTPQPSPAAPRWPHPLLRTHSAAGLLPRREGPGNPARRRRRHWCVTGAPTPGSARPKSRASPKPALPGSAQPWRVYGSRQIPKCRVGTASSGYFTWGHLGCLTPRKVGAVSADAEHLEMRTNLTQTSLSNAGKTATRPGLAEQLPPSQSQGCEWTARNCCHGESWRLPTVRWSWPAKPRPNGTVFCESHCKPMNYQTPLP